MDTIGSRIIQARGERSQGELAETVGISRNSLGKYERDERAPPADTAQKLARALGVEPAWLLYGTGKQESTSSPDPKDFIDRVLWRVFSALDAAWQTDRQIPALVHERGLWLGEKPVGLEYGEDDAYSFLAEHMREPLSLDDIRAIADITGRSVASFFTDELRDDVVRLPIFDRLKSRGTANQSRALIRSRLKFNYGGMPVALGLVEGLGNLFELSAFAISDKAMEPTLSQYDHVVVRDADAASDGLYLLHMGGDLMVRRLQCFPKGVIRVSGDNPTHKSFDMTAGDDDPVILGRVVAVWKRV